MMQKSFVVTGASTGIGRACVSALVSSGAHVWATVRSNEDELALKDDYHDAVTPLRMDLTDADSILEAGERIRAAGPLNGLVNNAGVALPGPLEYIPMDSFRRQIEINLIGQLAVTQTVLPALRCAHEEGAQARIVMVGSAGGRIAGPMLGPYHTSKFGLVGLTNSLRAELAPSGIRVALIELGPVATPIWVRGAAAAEKLRSELDPKALALYSAQIENAAASAERSAKRGRSPERVAAVLVQALTSRRPKARYLVGPEAHAVAIVTRLSERLVDKVVAARR